MKKTFFALIIGLCFSFLSSCWFMSDDAELTLPRRPYTGKELRIDGYYRYQIKSDAFYDFFLYQNGVILNFLTSVNNGVVDFSENRFVDAEYIKKMKDSKLSWMIFIVEGEGITIQGWNPGGGPFGLCTQYGKILNDTTFVINSYRINEEKLQSTNEVFNFHQFSPKPDSTNAFIK